MPSGSLAPSLLLAMPQMLDPNFARSVVLLCRSDGDGAMGLVVNRPGTELVGDVVKFDPPIERPGTATVWQGGPVEPQRGWLLLGYKPNDGDAIEISEGLYLASSMRLLRELVEDGTRPARFLVGYAGWGGGQLESELTESAWLTADVSHELLFETPPEKMWEAAIRGLGVDPFALQTGSGIH